MLPQTQTKASGARRLLLAQQQISQWRRIQDAGVVKRGESHQSTANSPISVPEPAGPIHPVPFPEQRPPTVYRLADL